MDNFETWKHKRSSANADTNKMLIIYMIIAFVIIVSLKIYNESDAYNLKCIISDVDIYNKLKNEKNNIPTLQDIYSFNEISGVKNWKELVENGNKLSNDDAVHVAKDHVKSTDLALIKDFY